MKKKRKIHIALFTLLFALHCAIDAIMGSEAEYFNAWYFITSPFTNNNKIYFFLQNDLGKLHWFITLTALSVLYYQSSRLLSVLLLGKEG